MRSLFCHFPLICPSFGGFIWGVCFVIFPSSLLLSVVSYEKFVLSFSSHLSFFRWFHMRSLFCHFPLISPSFGGFIWGVCFVIFLSSLLLSMVSYEEFVLSFFLSSVLLSVVSYEEFVLSFSSHLSFFRWFHMRSLFCHFRLISPSFGGFIWGVCFVIFLSSLLLLMPPEGCAS